MGPALYDGIEVLGNVMVTPNEHSHLVVARRRGEIGTVIDRYPSGSMAVMFDSGTTILVNRSEVARVD